MRTTPWCRDMMVKGRNQPTKIQSSKRNPVVAVKSATTSSSPAQVTSKAKAQKQLLLSCNGCGAATTDDIKALQCDRCQAIESWKCADCLNIPVDMYDHLVADPNCSLLVLCQM